MVTGHCEEGNEWKCILCGAGFCSDCIDANAELFFNLRGEAVCICKNCLDKEKSGTVGVAS